MSGNIRIPKNWQGYAVPNWAAGLNLSNAKKKPNELLDGKNCNLTKEGVAVKRGGNKKCNAAALVVSDENISAYQTGLRVENIAEVWETQTSAADNYWKNICWSPELDLFVAVAKDGAGNNVMTSPDGETWTSRVCPDKKWTSVCWSPELTLFVAVAYEDGTVNTIMTSPDGINWIGRIAPNTNGWRTVCWSPELTLFVAMCGAFTVANEKTMTSPDGINWTPRNSGFSNCYSVCWSPELMLFCAVSRNTGSTNQVATSPDGTTWTIRTSAIANRWVSVCWSPQLGLFAAVSDTGTDNRVMTSDDGSTWVIQESAIDNEWTSICWSPKLAIFCAVSHTGVNNQVMISPDGVIWTIGATTNSHNWISVCWNPELSMFCAVSYNGVGNRVMINVSVNDVKTVWVGSYDTKIYKAITDAADKLKVDNFLDTKSGLIADKWRWATLANKAIAFSIKNKPIWTNGGAMAYNLGVDAPSAPTGVQGGAGTMAPGTYQVGYTYYRDGNFAYETNASPNKSVTIIANRTIDVGVTASTDPQINKIRIYCSTLAGVILYYVDDVPNVTDTINIDVPNASGYEAPLDNYVPRQAKFVMTMNNRLFIAYTDDTDIGSAVIRWSKPNQPECFGANDFRIFDAEDDDELMGIGSLLNYIVVFKEKRIFLFDSQDLSSGDYMVIAKDHGCIAPDTICNVLNGKAIVYLSQEGVRLFDGKNNIRLDEDKIDIVFDTEMDKTTAYSKVQAVYLSTDKRYSIAIPVSGGYKWFNYYLDSGGWTNQEIFEPKTFMLARSKDNEIVIVGADRIINDVYFKEIDYGKDDDGANITARLETVPLGFGKEVENLDKVIRRAYIDWYSDGISTILVEDCEDAWDELVDVDVVSSSEITIKKAGNASAKLAVGVGVAAGDILATEAITSTDISGASFIRFWIRSSVATAVGDLVLLLDETAQCVSPSETIDIPALVADEWKEVTVALTAAAVDLDAIISVGIKCIVDIGAHDLYIDNIQAILSPGVTPNFKTTIDFGSVAGLTRAFTYTWGTTDRGISRIDLTGSGKMFTFCIEESSKNTLIIYGMEIFFYMVTLTGVEKISP